MSSGGDPEDSKILPPSPQIKVVGNDGSQGGRTVRVPTCGLLRGVSGDLFFILRSQWRRPVDLSMPTFQESQSQVSLQVSVPNNYVLGPLC